MELKMINRVAAGLEYYEEPPRYAHTPTTQKPSAPKNSGLYDKSPRDPLYQTPKNILFLIQR